MADSTTESNFQSHTLSPRHTSSSIFSVSGFFVGFGTKVSLDSDSVRSPTSPLDVGVFSNLRDPFSHRYASSSPQNGRQGKWLGGKIGLGIISSLVEDTANGVLDLPKQKNIIFGPQVKSNFTYSSKYYYDSLYSSLKSQSLPRNYRVSPLSRAKGGPNSLSVSKNVIFDNERVPLSLLSLSYDHNSSSSNFSSMAATRIGSPPVIGTGSEAESSSTITSSTLPIPIDSSQGTVGSLSAKEIELSEDYTCIISHGPNPKTIHIFGDCILESHSNEPDRFGKKEELGSKSPHPAENPDGLSPDHTDEVSRFCYSCKKKLEDGEDIHMYRGEKAFCSFECRAGEISEEETERTCKSSAGSSPDSSYHEDIFLLGMPLAM
ncbi:hypothetical protein UlMin_044223 [Ulmus minor]